MRLVRAVSGETPIFDTTSSASMDERKTWMLPGDSYLVVMAGGFAGIVCFVFASAAKQPLIARFLVGAIPMALVGVYLCVAVLGKPPHYAADWWTKIGRSKSFANDPRVLDDRRSPHFLSGEKIHD